MENSLEQNITAGSNLHPRNLHRGRYNFTELCSSSPGLSGFLKQKPNGEDTIDFSDPAALVALNGALLSLHYDINNWQIPEGYLCPPIPGRADYIHYIADILAEENKGIIPRSKSIRVLDIGTGASCIYPILGNRIYGWKFVGSEINPAAVKSARRIVEDNTGLNKLIKVVHQKDKKKILKGIIREIDSYDISICNPPFHKSIAKVEAASKRKWKNLKKRDADKRLNFGGKDTELCFPGGELAFIAQMIVESREFQSRVGWFTSLVSNGDNIPPLKKLLKESGCKRQKIIEMKQGQKNSRFIAWSFMVV